MIKTLELYFDAHSLLDLVLLVINGALATGTAVTLLFSSQTTVGNHSALRWYERGIRFILTAAYAVLALRVWMGWYYTPVEPTHVAVNALVFALVLLAHGDVAVIIRSLQQVRVMRKSEMTAGKRDHGKR